MASYAVEIDRSTQVKNIVKCMLLRKNIQIISVETMRGRGKEVYWLWKIKIYKFRLS